mgnify:CR=1 FL=1
MGTILAVCVSEKKGTQKKNIQSARLVENWGIENDAHAGNWHRQVSLLAEESVDTMRAAAPMDLPAGAFAENINTRGLALKTLPVGTLLKVGPAILRVTQIGKECHNDCAIKKAVGRCVMPTEGIFATVEREGTVRPGDTIEVWEGTL